jgi:hypothetical protein
VISTFITSLSAGYSKRARPGLVMRRSTGSVTVMTAKAIIKPLPVIV